MKQSTLLAMFVIFSLHGENIINPTEQITQLAKEYCTVANYFEQHGHTNKAKELYIKSLSLEDSSLVHAKLGCLYYDENNITEAITHLTTSLKQQPHNAHIHFNLGQCYVKQNEWRGAFAEFQKTITLDQHHERAYLQLGSVCEKLQLPQDAIMAYEKALEINPKLFEAYHNLGNLQRSLGDLEKAIEPYRTAHNLQPNNLHVMMDLANVLNQLNYNQESLELYEKIVEKNSNALPALYNFGFTLKKMGYLERAIDVYLELLAKKPDYAPVHFSLASIYLTLGNYEQGFKEYEWRWKSYSEEERTYNKPRWNGEDIVGRTLFVYAEQGLGDTLQFIRYLQLLKEKSKYITIIFESQEALIPLLKNQPYIDKVISRHETPPHFHYHIPLMSLPYVLQTRIKTIPAITPYIEPPEAIVRTWQEKLAPDKNFKIGICWQGNARYSTPALQRAVAAKSLPLSLFAPLFTIPGISIYSLQRIDGIDQIERCSFKDKLILFDDSFDQASGRFIDTAAVMKQLDLVITVDTGTCHLAGAMNIPTWILLPQPTDWRWLLDRSDSPWYPSVRLFRQHRAGEWDGVIADITQELYRISQKKKENTSPAKELLFTKPFHPTNEQNLFFEQLINSL